MTSKAFRWTILGTAAAALLWHSPALAAGKEPIRIGLITSLSGPYQGFGGAIKEGAQFAADDINAKGGIDGRKVELEFGDTQGNPEIGRREAGKLVLKGYNLLTGGVSSAVSLAISGQMERIDGLYIATLSKSNLITGKQCNARTFRTFQNDAMDIRILKPWLEKQTDKKWAIIAADYAWGHDSAEGFTEAAKSAGKEVLPAVYAPLGAKDFAPYITQLMQSGATALWGAVSGGDYVNFWKQATQFGLPAKMKVAAAAAVTTSVINALGDIAEGYYGIVNYSSTEPSAGNQAFVKAFRAKFGKDPGYDTVNGYLGVAAIAQAVGHAHSVKPGDVARAMGGMTLKTPMFGDVVFRAADHQLELPNYFGRVGRDHGELKPIIDQTFSAAETIPPPSPDCHIH